MLGISNVIINILENKMLFGRGYFHIVLQIVRGAARTGLVTHEWIKIYFTAKCGTWGRPFGEKGLTG